MELFSSNAEETINKSLLCSSDNLQIESEKDLITIFSLEPCLFFIKQHGFSQVCLQFPDSILQYSVQVALWLEKKLNQKVFILGDTSYGSCCVDELAAEHVAGDAVIHMGHACLSPTSRLPVFYVFPIASLDLPHFFSAFSSYSSRTTGSILLLYDVAYSHLLNDLREGLVSYNDRLFISQLCVPRSESQPCGPECELLRNFPHAVTLLGRSFCCRSPSSVVYIANSRAQNILNFALSLQEAEFFIYSKDSDSKTVVDLNKTLRRRLFLVEKIKDAKTIGIVVGTLSVENFLGAIERVKKLAAYRGKRCYVFSIGKPNPAKLANFPEIDVFVLVSCAEACLENEREYMKPVVTLLEMEVALNPNRQWNDKLSVDFRDLLEGGENYKPLPEGQEPLEADVSLVTNRIRSDLMLSDSGTGAELSVREHYQISLANSYLSGRPVLVNDLCQYYGLDPEEICEEVNAFSQVYKVGYQNIDLADVLHSPDTHSQYCDEDSGEENSEVVVDVNKDPKLAKQIKYLDQWLEVP